jgi:hypothetical protein
MKKCISAVRYGLETLKVSSDRLFNLIETSRGYTGDIYERWLAARIIDVAEADGVGFSQLLVKKFNILMELSEMDGVDIRKDYLKFFCKLIGAEQSDVYTVGFGHYDFFNESRKLDSVDWYTGVDYDEENSFFTDALDSDELKTSIRSGVFPVLLNLSPEGVGKKSDLFLDAKSRGLNLKNIGSALLYRLCLLYDVYGCSESCFCFICPVEFLYDDGNTGIFGELLGRFRVSGYAVSDLNPYFGDYAICVCRPYIDDTRMDGIYLSTGHMGMDGEFEKTSKGKLYTRSRRKMVDTLRAYKAYMKDTVRVENNGKVVGSGIGFQKALGYLNIGSTVSLSTLPLGSSSGNTGESIPITKSNLLEVIGYYGLYKSNEENGCFTDINSIVGGHARFSEMVCNCLPVFLYDYDSLFKGYEVDGEVVENHFSGSSLAALISNAEVNFSFEAKELMGICKYFYTEAAEKGYTAEKLGSMSFLELRKSLVDTEADKMYYQRLSNLKKYISSSYRGVVY